MFTFALNILCQFAGYESTRGLVRTDLKWMGTNRLGTKDPWLRNDQ